ncbi:ThuA domain-containing protein [Natronoglycomyces albus]|uniref:ThuA domain-containing protein n=1 Tax=Natronoglycomyces albus TaxID=2811108 RepID=A0A895XKP5_9ACTN|nr:ThuA domain-containing protein [Natronoglycomyces albus]QSB04382.1 ThuA domain-containing protein [Natronoglycomyces albus]
MTSVIFVCLLAFAPAPVVAQEPKPQVLIVTNSHNSDERQIVIDYALERYGMELRRWGMDYTKGDPSDVNAHTLANTDVVVFLHTLGRILDQGQRQALEDYMRQGGGFVGVGSAASTETEWPYFHELIGAVATDADRAETSKEVTFATEHLAARGMGDDWEPSDHWLTFDRDPEQMGATIVASVDSGHPVAWQQQLGHGRSFYTSLGGAYGTWGEREFGKFLRQATWWAAGNDAGLRQDSTAAAPHWPYTAAFILLVGAVATGGIIAVARSEQATRRPASAEGQPKRT